MSAIVNKTVRKVWVVVKKAADGKDFKYEDFTPEQLEVLKLKFEDLSPEDKAELALKFEDLTPEQVESLKTDIEGEASEGVVTLDNVAGRIYGEDAPLTGDITLDLTGAKLGGGAIIYHNDSTAPSFSPEINKMVFGSYSIGLLNVITIVKTGISTLSIIYSQPASVLAKEYIDWEQEIKATDAGNGTLQFIPHGVYDIGAYSSKAIAGNNAVSFQCPPAGSKSGQAVGLTNTYGGITSDKFTMDICVIVNSVAGDKIYVYEDGTSVFASSLGAYQTGDVLTLKVEDGLVSILQNESVIYTSLKTYTLPLTAIGVGYKSSSDYTDSEIFNAVFENNNLITSPL